jgi:hypothetical protein
MGVPHVEARTTASDEPAGAGRIPAHQLQRVQNAYEMTHK